MGQRLLGVREGGGRVGEALLGHHVGGHLVARHPVAALGGGLAHHALVVRWVQRRAKQNVLLDGRLLDPRLLGRVRKAPTVHTADAVHKRHFAQDGPQQTGLATADGPHDDGQRPARQLERDVAEPERRG